MSLRQRKVATIPSEPALTPSEDRDADSGSSRQAGILLAVVGALLLALAAGDALADVRDGAMLGSTGAETLRGSSGQNWISGSGGADTLHGLAGRDLLVGGGENDEVFGGPGADKLLAGTGNDFVEASDGERDYVDCGPGRDAASVDDLDYVVGSCERVYPD